MNLIEQLGGYERAKRIEKNIYGTGGRLIRYPSKDFDYNDDGGNVCDVELISFKANDLKKSLLEHRRENNIYEEGDWIIYDDELMVFAMWSKHHNEYAYIGYANADDGALEHRSAFRHATDEEIAQGYRDE